MSCYGCLTKFSFFTKEHSCSNCGFSFCKKCLRQKIVLTEEKNVCQNCYKKLTSNMSSDAETPDLLKRLETLENPAKPPITLIRHSNKLTNLKYGLSSEDKKILERLEKLKSDRIGSNLPDEQEIKRRLALLQDRSEESIKEKPHSFKIVTKTQQEQVDDLLSQYLDETGMETDLASSGKARFDDLSARLKKLQTSESNSEQAESKSQEADDGDDITAMIIKRAIAEGKLEKKLEDSFGKNEVSSDISDLEESDGEAEYPWCIICNEDASLRCFGCDGNLYCKVCFKQGHEFFNMEDHKHVPYTRKDSLS